MFNDLSVKNYFSAHMLESVLTALNSGR